MKGYQKVFALCVFIVVLYLVLHLRPIVVERYNIFSVFRNYNEAYNTFGILKYHNVTHSQSWMCSKDTQILNTRTYTLKTSESLFTGIESLNALLECIMKEYHQTQQLREVNSKEPYGWNISHISVVKCMGCVHTEEDKPLHGSMAVKPWPSSLKLTFDRLKSKKFQKAESNPKYSKSNYFEVINAESSVFTVLFSWMPFVESK